MAHDARPLLTGMLPTDTMINLLDSARCALETSSFCGLTDREFQTASPEIDFDDSTLAILAQFLRDNGLVATGMVISSPIATRRILLVARTADDLNTAITKLRRDVSLGIKLQVNFRSV